MLILIIVILIVHSFSRELEYLDPLRVPPAEEKKPLLFFSLSTFAIRICFSERMCAQCERNSTSAPLNDVSHSTRSHWNLDTVKAEEKKATAMFSMLLASIWQANIIERRACWVAFTLGAHPFGKADADGKISKTKNQKWLFFLPEGV